MGSGSAAPRGGEAQVINPEPQALQPEHVANCRVWPSREAMLTGLPRGGAIAEVGTQTGRWAEQMLAVCWPSELHLYDTDLSEAALYLDGLGYHDDTMRLHQGDSSTMLAELPDHHLDWAYIDADHSFEGVTRDVKVAMDKVKPDGLLVFNDYTLWSILEGAEYGVVQVVNGLLANHGYEIVHFAFQPLGYHDVALRRIQ